MARSLTTDLNDVFWADYFLERKFYKTWPPRRTRCNGSLDIVLLLACEQLHWGSWVSCFQPEDAFIVLFPSNEVISQRSEIGGQWFFKGIWGHLRRDVDCWLSVWPLAFPWLKKCLLTLSHMDWLIESSIYQSNQVFSLLQWTAPSLQERV